MSTASIGKIAPIKREVVAEQVAQRLLSLIQSGNLKRGQQLPPERELAVMLDVSRPSLREALRALSLLGVIRIRPGGGAFVSSLDPEALLAPIHFFIALDAQNLDSLLDARIVIEAGMARLAAAAVRKSDIAKLAKCLEQQEQELGDIDRFVETDDAFHKTLFDMVDNPFLIKIASSLHILGQASRRVTCRIPGVMAQSFADHKAILAALEARDGDRAAAAMEAHLRNVRYAHQQRASRRPVRLRSR